MRRLMQTTIALPSIASRRFSKCSTRSRAISLSRFSAPTTASSCAHLVLSFSLRSTSSPSVDLLELGVDLRPLGSFELQLGEPALVVDRHRGAVVDGALDVVDADVVAEDRARVGVGLLDRRAGEADERGVRQRVAHVAGEAVDEVVLAAVRLVGDDDDVAPVREHRVAVALLLGEELLDGGEDDAARRRPQSFARRSARSAACTGGWRSSSLAARERAEELVVEVVAVGEHDERRVLHRRVQDRRARRRTPSSGSCPSPACARPRRRAGRRARRPACCRRS